MVSHCPVCGNKLGEYEMLDHKLRLVAHLRHSHGLGGRKEDGAYRRTGGWYSDCPCGACFDDWSKTAEHYATCQVAKDAIALLILSGGVYKPVEENASEQEEA